MYIDWPQIEGLPEVNTLIDVGVGLKGTPELYSRFPKASLILIDPLEESRAYAKSALGDRNYEFHLTAVGSDPNMKQLDLNIERVKGRSTLLEVTEVNFEGEPVERRRVPITTIDKLLIGRENLGSIGIKIDTEGYECEVIRGAIEVLSQSSFVIAEVRHNHQSFIGGYELRDFIELMSENDFLLTRILTAKPLIADLCFERRRRAV
jgi:FkbM family methyltransferase